MSQYNTTEIYDTNRSVKITMASKCVVRDISTANVWYENRAAQITSLLIALLLTIGLYLYINTV